MYDLTIDDFPPDRLAAIVHWRNDPVVNRYLRQGILTRIFHKKGQTSSKSLIE